MTQIILIGLAQMKGWFFDTHMKSVSNSLWLLSTVIVLMGLASSSLQADGPADNQAVTVRPIPPIGTSLSSDQHTQLESDLEKLRQSIVSARKKLSNQPDLRRHLSDIEVFEQAVTSAILFQEIFDPAKEFHQAREQLSLATSRLDQLLAGKPGWLDETGLVPRGYVSRIDDSIQPYGLIVPESWNSHRTKPIRLDIWFHGRGEKLTELSFLNQRLHSAGQFTPEDTIVLHLYGRYCNANKFAGEMDLFEALNHVQQDYPIDNDRIIIRGFSM